MRYNLRILIVMGVLLVFLIINTPFVSAQTECIDCHDDIFTAQKVDRVTQCKDCHNDPDSFGHTGYS